MARARRGERVYKAFGKGQKCLGVGDLLTSLIERHGMRWTIVATMPQVLGCQQKAMKFGRDFPGARKVLTEGRDHSRVFGKGQTLSFEKGLRDVEHSIVHSGSCEVWIGPLQQPLYGSKTTSSLFKQFLLVFGQILIPSLRTLRRSGPCRCLKRSSPMNAQLMTSL